MTSRLYRDHEVATIAQENITSSVEKKLIKSAYKKNQVFTTGRYDKDGELDITLTVDEVVVKTKFRNIAERNGKVGLKFNISIPKSLQDKYYNVLISPRLFIGRKDTIPQLIEPLLIRGYIYASISDRQQQLADKYRLLYKSRGVLNAKNDSLLTSKTITTVQGRSMLLDTILSTPDNIVYTYIHELPIKEDITKVFITIGGEVVSIDNTSYKLPQVDTIQYNLSTLNKFIDLRPRYIEKIVSKYAVVEDKRSILFKIGKTYVIDTLGDNKAEFAKIYSLLDSMFVQDEFIIDSIKLIAGSSPDGSVHTNKQYAQARVEALSKYLIKGAKIDSLEELIKPTSIGENWAELVSLISHSDLEEKSAILEVINDYLSNGKNLDELENIKLRKFKEYKEIRDSIYPQLRSVKFSYSLRRKDMLQDTIRTNEIDQTYLKGINLIKKRRYREALEVFKHYKDRNHALCLINLNHNRSALSLLKTLPSDEDTNYLLAIVLCRLNKLNEAKECFNKALEFNSHLKFRAGLDPELKPLLDIMPNLFNN